MKNYKFKLVAVNENGQRVGETHPRARLTDADVDLIRELREDHGLTYQQLADKFDVSKSLIRYICKYQRRAQTPATWRRVPDTKG